MVPSDIIRQAVDRFVAQDASLKVILFGSQARGEATDNSDIDFLIIKASVKDKIGDMIQFRRALKGLGISADVMVCSQQEIIDWGHLPGTALYWALKEGKVLYDATH
jgi:uncharacterized protein